MGITKQFTGFDNENFQLGFIESKGWKTDVQSAADGDYTEVVCNEVPTYADDSNKVEVKKIGVVKRNAMQFIGASKGTLNIVQLLNENYSNVYAGLIEATIGKMVLPVTLEGKAVEKDDVTITDGYNITCAAGTFEDFYNEDEKIQLVGFYDKVSGKLVDMDTIISIPNPARLILIKILID